MVLCAVTALVLAACADGTATPSDTTSETATTVIATASPTVPAVTIPTTAAPIAPATTVPALPTGDAAVVERVVDGDTIVLVGGERVRLIGVDTPETKDPRKSVQCFGKEAAAFTSTLLPPGTHVRVVLDVEPRDRFGRTLAYVYREADGLFVNAELVRNGYAQLMTIPPNVAHVDEFRALQTEARDGGRGLWSAC